MVKETIRHQCRQHTQPQKNIYPYPVHCRKTIYGNGCQVNNRPHQVGYHIITRGKLSGWLHAINLLNFRKISAFCQNILNGIMHQQALHEVLDNKGNKPCYFTCYMIHIVKCFVETGTGTFVWYGMAFPEVEDKCPTKIWEKSLSLLSFGGCKILKEALPGNHTQRKRHHQQSQWLGGRSG